MRIALAAVSLLVALTGSMSTTASAQTDAERLARFRSEAFGVVPNQQNGHWFAQKGSALAVVKETLKTGLIDVFSLDGKPVEAEPRDALPLVHGMVDMGGQRIGGGVVAFVADSYLALDVPDGPELYDMVWSTLPPEMQAEVTAERIVRP